MSIGLILVAMATAAVIVWRGMALYRYTFHKKDL